MALEVKELQKSKTAADLESTWLSLLKNSGLKEVFATWTLPTQSVVVPSVLTQLSSSPSLVGRKEE